MLPRANFFNRTVMSDCAPYRLLLDLKQGATWSRTAFNLSALIHPIATRHRIDAR
jgi:hypothetical protein